MQRKNRLTTRKLAFYAILIIILISLFLLFYSSYSMLDIKYINYDYKVQGQKKLGFNLDTDALHFGIILPGGGGQRDLILKTDKRARVLIKVLGDNVTPNINNFILEPDTESKVQFNAYVPPETPPGNYSGRIRIIFKRA